MRGQESYDEIHKRLLPMHVPLRGQTRTQKHNLRHAALLAFRLSARSAQTRYRARAQEAACRVAYQDDLLALVDDEPLDDIPDGLLVVAHGARVPVGVRGRRACGRQRCDLGRVAECLQRCAEGGEDLWAFPEAGD